MLFGCAFAIITPKFVKNARWSAQNVVSKLLSLNRREATSSMVCMRLVSFVHYGLAAQALITCCLKSICP